MATMTSHELARELLGKPDGYITAKTHDNREYKISSYQKVFTDANYDDRLEYWTLNLSEIHGNIL